MKIIQNTLKIEKKISNVSKKIWVGPQKVGSVGFPETRHFFFLALKDTVMTLTFSTDRSGQTVQTQIRLLLADQGLHCLLFHLHLFNKIL